ncbi:unnamed protein product [Euphydryas editha]|uniref:Uncharacterized protein n=1 Tax=Euphydryas editha TaxID=104508 RepID=A0AAU9TYF6_EUPED|nr:unnamed protein product [Euphydryas editha]
MAQSRELLGACACADTPARLSSASAVRRSSPPLYECSSRGLYSTVVSTHETHAGALAGRVRVRRHAGQVEQRLGRAPLLAAALGACACADTPARLSSASAVRRSSPPLYECSSRGLYSTVVSTHETHAGALAGRVRVRRHAGQVEQRLGRAPLLAAALGACACADTPARLSSASAVRRSSPPLYECSSRGLYSTVVSTHETHAGALAGRVRVRRHAGQVEQRLGRAPLLAAALGACACADTPARLSSASAVRRSSPPLYECSSRGLYSTVVSTHETHAGALAGRVRVRRHAGQVEQRLGRAPLLAAALGACACADTPARLSSASAVRRSSPPLYECSSRGLYSTVVSTHETHAGALAGRVRVRRHAGQVEQRLGRAPLLAAALGACACADTPARLSSASAVRRSSPPLYECSSRGLYSTVVSTHETHAGALAGRVRVRRHAGQVEQRLGRAPLLAAALGACACADTPARLSSASAVRRSSPPLYECSSRGLYSTVVSTHETHAGALAGRVRVRRHAGQVEQRLGRAPLLAAALGACACADTPARLSSASAVRRSSPPLYECSSRGLYSTVVSTHETHAGALAGRVRVRRHAGQVEQRLGRAPLLAAALGACACADTPARLSSASAVRRSSPPLYECSSRGLYSTVVSTHETHAGALAGRVRVRRHAGQVEQRLGRAPLLAAALGACACADTPARLSSASAVRRSSPPLYECSSRGLYSTVVSTHETHAGALAGRVRVRRHAGQVEQRLGRAPLLAAALGACACADTPARLSSASAVRRSSPPLYECSSRGLYSTVVSTHETHAGALAGRVRVRRHAGQVEQRLGRAPLLAAALGACACADTPARLSSASAVRRSSPPLYECSSRGLYSTVVSTHETHAGALAGRVRVRRHAGQVEQRLGRAPLLAAAVRVLVARTI